ncbi:MAG: ArsR family transcriptional regulator [Nitrosopumilus sp. H8]|nr:MAG: ArsR family transcriptional regulator [Nitrosopumilus sp. H8]
MAKKRFALPRTKRFDVSQKIIEALADTEARMILFSVVKKGHTAASLADILKLPLSSVYKKIGDLEDLTLIEVEKQLLTDKGRTFKVYRSRIRSANIAVNKIDPKLTLVPRR